MLPSPGDLEYFTEIAATKNISRAAERLGISQPTLSMAIQRLETNIGAKLLIRSKTGVQLTRAGKRLAVNSRSLIRQWHDLKKKHARKRGRNFGTIQHRLPPFRRNVFAV